MNSNFKYFYIVLLMSMLLACSNEGQERGGLTEQKAVVSLKPVTSFPKQISTSCREGIANIYDECGSQKVILENALIAAQATDTRVVILYGAEWCIWCHVFDKYVKGESNKFTYEWQYHDGDNLDWTMYDKANKQAEEEATELNEYFANHFVLAHIESHYSPDGVQVLADLGYEVNSILGVPVILALNESGEIVAEMKSSKELIGLEIREDSGREFRGYDRKLLLSELQRMHKLTN